jgi:hypothetical protein
MNRIKTQREPLATEKAAERPRLFGANDLRRVSGGVPVKTGARAGLTFQKMTIKFVI